MFAHAAAGDAADIDAAVKAARKAFESPPWATMTPAQRARLLLKLADLIEANGDEIALLETLDNGMPFRMAKFGGVFGAAESLRYHAGWATKMHGATINLSMPGEWHAYTLREPVGVVGQIVPWNFPFVMGVAKIAPALAVGCTVVLKPAEQTPLTTIRLGELIAEAGFPEGVVNIVTGFGETAGRALVAHPDVNKIAFTGSTSVGKEILKACAGNLKRVTLELGGKSPVIIFPDAALEPATEVAARGIFMNAGQVCAAGSRLFVHEKVFDQVVEGVVARAQKLNLGAGHRAHDRDRSGGVRSAAQARARLHRVGQERWREGAHGWRRAGARGLFRRAHGAHRHHQQHESGARGNLRAGAVRDEIRRHRSRRDRAHGQRHRLRSRGQHLDARHLARRTSWRRRSARARCASTPRARSIRPCRSAATSNPAGAARTAAKARRSTRK